MAQAQATSVTLQTAVRVGHAAATISAFAQEGSFDLVVLGVGEGRGPGSTADRVVESATCSVLIVRSAFWHLRVADVMSREVTPCGPTRPWPRWSSCWCSAG